MKTKHWKVVGLIVLAAAILCVVSYADKSVSLPSAVKAAIDALYPNSEIEESTTEEEGVEVYEVELEQNGQDIELTITTDGTVIEEEIEVGMNDLPAAVKAAIIEAAGDAKIEEVKKEMEYMEVQLVKLQTPKISYEAEIEKDGKETKIEIASDGTLKKQNEDNQKGDDDDEDDDDDGDDEDEDDE